MRNKDYFRLARLSLWAKKKTTLQTVVGLSFGLILLFPMLFLAIGFYGGFSAEINANPANRTMRVEYARAKTDAGDVRCYDEYEENIDKISGIKNSLKFDYYYLDNAHGRYLTYTLDDGEIKSLAPPNLFRNVKERNIGLQVIDKECAHKPLLDMDYYLVRKPLVAGRVFSKGDASKGEIMVSTKFLTDMGLEAKDVIGKSFTLYNKLSKSSTKYSTSDTEYTPTADYYIEHETIPYLKDYKIIGVYHSNVYLRQSPRNYSMRFNSIESYTSRLYSRDYFWITSASLGPEGEAIAPKNILKQTIHNEEVVNENWFYYSDHPKVLAEEITDAGYTFLPICLGAFSKGMFLPLYEKTHLIEFHSFEVAKGGYDEIFKNYRLSVTGDPDNTYIYKYPSNIAPNGFFVYQEFFDRFLFLCLAFGVFGGVIFIATMLNLINTLHFSVQSSKGFLGICRAQGLKRKEVTRLFFNQITLIFLVAYTSAILIGGAACIAIREIFNSTLRKQIEVDTDMVLTLQWWYIPIALLVLIVITTSLSLIISHALVRKVNKTPVLEILSEENRM